jgi:hypothetical protein
MGGVLVDWVDYVEWLIEVEWVSGLSKLLSTTLLKS